MITPASAALRVMWTELLAADVASNLVRMANGLVPVGAQHTASVSPTDWVGSHRAAGRVIRARDPAAFETSDTIGLADGVVPDNATQQVEVTECPSADRARLSMTTTNACPTFGALRRVNPECPFLPHGAGERMLDAPRSGAIRAWSLVFGASNRGAGGAL